MKRRIAFIAASIVALILIPLSPSMAGDSLLKLAAEAFVKSWAILNAIIACALLITFNMGVPSKSTIETAISWAYPMSRYRQVQRAMLFAMLFLCALFGHHVAGCALLVYAICMAIIPRDAYLYLKRMHVEFGIPEAAPLVEFL